MDSSIYLSYSIEAPMQEVGGVGRWRRVAGEGES